MSIHCHSELICQLPDLQCSRQTAQPEGNLECGDGGCGAGWGGRLMDVKGTKEDFTSQMDFCSLLILEGGLHKSSKGPSRRSAHSAAPGSMKQNTR